MTADDSVTLRHIAHELRNWIQAASLLCGEIGEETDSFVIKELALVLVRSFPNLNGIAEQIIATSLAIQHRQQNNPVTHSSETPDKPKRFVFP